MKKACVGAAVLGVTGLLGCGNVGGNRIAAGQVIELGPNKTRLLVSTEGGQVAPGLEYTRTPRSNGGTPIHRVLQTADGKVLFAYDLQVSESDDPGAYRFLLKPYGNGPTFAKTRAVSVKVNDDAVRVELMEQPSTGKKIVDVFRVLDGGENGSEDQSNPILAHLMKAHNAFFHWIHGQ